MKPFKLILLIAMRIALSKLVDAGEEVHGTLTKSDRPIPSKVTLASDGDLA